MNCSVDGFQAPPARQASEPDRLAVPGGDDLPLTAWCRRHADWLDAAALAAALAAVLAFALPFLLQLAR